SDDHHGSGMGSGSGAPGSPRPHRSQRTAPAIMAPFCCVPSSAKRVRDVRLAPDWKVNPPAAPENVPRACAREKRPRKEAGSVGATALPRPRLRAFPLAFHVIWKLTTAGTSPLAVVSITVT